MHALYADPIAAGRQPKQVAIVAGGFVIGVVFFCIMKAYRRSRGIDVNLAFKAIPIE